ncbi:unnamed protein product (macronuclear) [Paramecium tetraurelia]|uniref:LNR domain-containing protein n=1 Tax=Paramecium tetraurelia TaxID=5888 RepID=A0DPP6_PARTE|nr:uncharacterized protein GSPATT00019195001 [Paramecium tetraurelia]CAK85013.1 unnamed protein product [Paramecium tetraurelia]|eukprot:XP_001452410.1 hypothetical protein (macronuclear) [Paramecium tetraurelia strain d4-2]
MFAMRYVGMVQYQKKNKCDDDDDLPDDGCYNCKYSCYPACPLCILGECVDDCSACKEAQFQKICGDGILVKPDEECDQFSNEEDFQFQNCKKICNQHCYICDDNKKCIQCKINYELFDGKCYANQLNNDHSLINNCIYYEDSQCKQCSIDYFYHPFENKCVPVCCDGIILDGKLCDDGNKINGDGCDSKCKPSIDSQCVNKQGISFPRPIPLLKLIKEIGNSQIVYLTMIHRQNYQTIIQFKFLQTPSNFKQIMELQINSFLKLVSQIKNLINTFKWKLTLLSIIYQDYDSIAEKIEFNNEQWHNLLIILLFIIPEAFKQQNTYLIWILMSIKNVFELYLLVICFKSPILQIQYCALNEFMYFYYLSLQKKQLHKIELFKKQFTHFNLFVINFMYLKNELLKNDPFKIILIGWVIIALMISIISITLLVDICKILYPLVQNLLDQNLIKKLNVNIQLILQQISFNS